MGHEPRVGLHHTSNPRRRTATAAEGAKYVDVGADTEAVAAIAGGLNGLEGPGLAQRGDGLFGETPILVGLLGASLQNRDDGLASGHDLLCKRIFLNECHVTHLLG